MLQNNLKQFRGDNQGDSMLFFRLNEKIDLLEDHLDELKQKYHKIDPNNAH